MVSYGILISAIVVAAMFGTSIGLFVSSFAVLKDDEDEEDEE